MDTQVPCLDSGRIFRLTASHREVRSRYTLPNVVEHPRRLWQLQRDRKQLELPAAAGMPSPMPPGQTRKAGTPCDTSGPSISHT